MTQPSTERYETFRRLLPHCLIVAAAISYMLLGGYAFYLIESRGGTVDQQQRPDQQQQQREEHQQQQDLMEPQCSSDAPMTMIALRRACKSCEQYGLRRRQRRPRRLSRRDQRHLKKECEEALRALSMCLMMASSKLSPATTTTTTTTTTPSSLMMPAAAASQMRCGDRNQKEWSWATGVVLAFTIVTTIGYGHVAPSTTAGRLFCIVYGVFGIPLVLMALANQGRYLSSWLLSAYKHIKRLLRYLARRCGRRRPPDAAQLASKPLMTRTPSALEDASSLASDEQPQQSIPAAVLLCMVLAYLTVGGCLISGWQQADNWSFVDGMYFVFASSASIGFGDLLPPKNGARMAFTFLYISFGLALTTTAIDIFAEYLRKLHYWGVKIKNAASTFVWFGGNKVTINQLVRAIGQELGASEDKIKTLVKHMDSLVNTAIQEEDQSETAEDMQAHEVLTEEIVPERGKLVLVHENSMEFAIAKATHLMPVILSADESGDKSRRFSGSSMISQKAANGRRSTTIRSPVDSIGYIDYTCVT